LEKKYRIAGIAVLDVVEGVIFFIFALQTISDLSQGLPSMPSPT
jgi:hypothetical protein